MQIDDAGLASQILGWLGSAVVAVLSAIWAGVKTVLTRLRHVEANSVPRAEFDLLDREAVRKDDFKDYAERSERSRTELRDAVVKLFDKFDELKTIIIERKQ